MLIKFNHAHRWIYSSTSNPKYLLYLITCLSSCLISLLSACLSVFRVCSNLFITFYCHFSLSIVICKILLSFVLLLLGKLHLLTWFKANVSFLNLNTSENQRFTRMILAGSIAEEDISKKLIFQSLQKIYSHSLPTGKSFKKNFNPFVPSVLFLYLLKTSENFKVFWVFWGVENECTGSK